MAGGMARDIENLEVETKIWQGNEIAAFYRVVYRGNSLSSGTEDRGLPSSENLVDAADVIAVMVGEKNCAELQLPRLENLENERGLPRIHNHRR